MEPRSTPDGDRVFVATDEVERGSDGPFYVLYATPDGSERYGFLCGNCEGFDTAMDPMGRVVCDTCGNTRKPDEWDAAHE